MAITVGNLADFFCYLFKEKRKNKTIKKTDPFVVWPVLVIVLLYASVIIRGIKHDFPFINIRKVPREVLNTEGVAQGFQPSRGTLRMLMNDKIMIGRWF